MKDNDQKLLWEAYVSETTHSPENSCKDDEYYCSEDKVCKPKKDKESVKKEAVNPESGERWSDEVDLNAGMKDLISDNSDLVGDFYKVYDSRNPDHVEAHDEIVRSLWNTYNLLDQSVRQFVGETKSKKPIEGPEPGSQEDYDRMDVDDPNHWQNSGAMPPGY